MELFCDQPLRKQPHIAVFSSSKVGNFVVITPLLRGLKAKYPDCTLDFFGSDITEDFEIIYVDDCGPGESWSALSEFCSVDRRVKALRLLRNFGQQRAVLCGLSQASGEYLVTMDDDLQHRPEEIKVLLDTLLNSRADIVIGSYIQKKHGFLRGLGTKLVSRLAAATLGVPKDLKLTSFRVLRRKIAEAVVEIRNPNPVVGFLLFQVTRNIINVEVHHDQRFSEESSYTFRSLLQYFSVMLFDYSDLPLRWVGWLGFSLSILSTLLGVYYFMMWSLGYIGVSGFTTIVLLQLFFFGVTFVALSLIGVYILRVFHRTGDLPLFIVREVKNL